MLGNTNTFLSTSAGVNNAALTERGKHHGLKSAIIYKNMEIFA